MDNNYKYSIFYQYKQDELIAILNAILKNGEQTNNLLASIDNKFTDNNTLLTMIADNTNCACEMLKKLVDREPLPEPNNTYFYWTDQPNDTVLHLNFDEYGSNDLPIFLSVTSMVENQERHFDVPITTPDWITITGFDPSSIGFIVNGNWDKDGNLLKDDRNLKIPLIQSETGKTIYLEIHQSASNEIPEFYFQDAPNTSDYTIFINNSVNEIVVPVVSLPNWQTWNAFGGNDLIESFQYEKQFLKVRFKPNNSSNLRTSEFTLIQDSGKRLNLTFQHEAQPILTTGYLTDVIVRKQNGTLIERHFWAVDQMRDGVFVASLDNVINKTPPDPTQGYIKLGDTILVSWEMWIAGTKYNKVVDKIFDPEIFQLVSGPVDPLDKMTFKVKKLTPNMTIEIVLENEPSRPAWNGSYPPSAP